MSIVAIALAGLLALALPAPSALPWAEPRPGEVVEYPDESPPLAVAVIADRVTPEGQWRQTVRLTLARGGTLGDASQAVYGNLLHVEELFAAARRLDPSLRSPALVPAGLVVELEVDPTRTFILERVSADAETLVRSFANGARETVRRRPRSSVVRLVELPRSLTAADFHFPTTDGPVTVPSGGRIVDYRYRPGDGFASLVGESLGTATFAAAAEISRQTGWSPTRWPPPADEARRVILGPAASYRPASMPLEPSTLPSPTARALADRLARERQRVGIQPVRPVVGGMLYRVAVEDPAARASDVSRLLYGDDGRRLELARRVGFAAPSDPAAAQSFDPPMFGTSLEVVVDYTQERFPYADERDEAAGAGVTRLLNGTVVERFDRAERDGQGVWEIVRYPTGARRVVYRPAGLTLALATGLAFVRGIGDLGTDAATIEAARRRHVAELVWAWSLRVPREPGDVPDTLTLEKLGQSEVVVAEIGEPAALTEVEAAVDRLSSQSPAARALAVLLLGTLLVLLVGLGAGAARQGPARR